MEENIVPAGMEVKLKGSHISEIHVENSTSGNKLQSLVQSSWKDWVRKINGMAARDDHPYKKYY
jgi:hypothetical protein